MRVFLYDIARADLKTRGKIMKNGQKRTKLISTLLLCCILALGVLVPIFSLTASANGYEDESGVIYTAETDTGTEPAPDAPAPEGRDYAAENAPYLEAII